MVDAFPNTARSGMDQPSFGIGGTRPTGALVSGQGEAHPPGKPRHTVQLTFDGSQATSGIDTGRILFSMAHTGAKKQTVMTGNALLYNMRLAAEAQHLAALAAQRTESSAKRQCMEKQHGTFDARLASIESIREHVNLVGCAFGAPAPAAMYGPVGGVATHQTRTHRVAVIHYGHSFCDKFWEGTARPNDALYIVIKMVPLSMATPCTSPSGMQYTPSEMPPDALVPDIRFVVTPSDKPPKYNSAEVLAALMSGRQPPLASPYYADADEDGVLELKPAVRIRLGFLTQPMTGHVARLGATEQNTGTVGKGSIEVFVSPKYEM